MFRSFMSILWYIVQFWRCPREIVWSPANLYQVSGKAVWQMRNVDSTARDRFWAWTATARIWIREFEMVNGPMYPQPVTVENQLKRMKSLDKKRWPARKGSRPSMVYKTCTKRPKGSQNTKTETMWARTYLTSSMAWKIMFDFFPPLLQSIKLNWCSNPMSLNANARVTTILNLEWRRRIKQNNVVWLRLVPCKICGWIVILAALLSYCIHPLLVWY